MNILELLGVGDKAAIIQGGGRISFSDLMGCGLRFGGRLRRAGIEPGGHVLVFVPLSIELYIAMIGAWSIGAVPVFVDYSRGSKFIGDNIDRLKPGVIVCDDMTRFIYLAYPKMRRIKMLRIKHEQGAGKQAGAGTLELFEAGKDHPAILTCTSGTTGLPKIAVRSHGFLVNQYDVLRNHMDYSPEHIDLGTLPVFTLASLAAGMTTLLPYKGDRTRINARRLAAKMLREGTTRAVCSPALMEKLLKHSQLPCLKAAYLGGGPVYPGLLGKIRQDVDLHIVYGSTEAEPISSIRWADVSAADREAIANGAGLLVGNPAKEVKCRIADDSEIQVSGETVLKGYLDGMGDSENKIRDGEIVWHRTGDAGRFDGQGRLWLLGRVSQAVNDAAGLLYPFCVECVLDARFGIRGAILSCGGERVVVIEKGAADADDVLRGLKPYHIARVVEVKRLPMDKRHGAKIEYERLRRAVFGR